MSHAHPTPPPLSSFGGLDGIRTILEYFYRRVFSDPMIGYLFVGQDLQRLVTRELEWTASALGVAIDYRGQPLARAHQRHPIRRGHFHRRNQLLLESMEACGLSPEASLWWRAHSLALESAILGQVAEDGDCERAANEARGQDEQSLVRGQRDQAPDQGNIHNSLSMWGAHASSKRADTHVSTSEGD